MTARRWLLVGVAAAVALAGAWWLWRPDHGRYRLTVQFERAVGLYAGGDVTLMGVDVGDIDDVVLEDTGVRVELSVDDDVRLPADVHATMQARTLIGEREVVLFPPWDPSMAGRPRARDGDVIPRARTRVPVEPDEGLEAFDELARGLEADVVAGMVHDAATVLDGRGEQLGALVEDAGRIATMAADLDEHLAATARSLHVLAGSLAEREEQLGRLVESFASASEVLAAERDGIRGFLSSLVTLTREARQILEVHGDDLPGDVAHLALLAEIFNRNRGSIEALVAAMPELADAIGEAYQPEIDGLVLRAGVNATLRGLFDDGRELLEDLLGELFP